MKTHHSQKLVASLVLASLISAGVTALAQDSSAPSPAQPAAVIPAAPRLSYGVSQILQLAQAKMGDDTIIAYIRNSGNGYNLNADQIIYLRQQGISDNVLTAMLSQPRAGAVVPTPSSPAPQPVASSVYSGQVSPATAYVQTVPDATYYSQPYYYYDQPYYYPAWGWYAPVSFYYGWGGGWGWHGGGYYGGYRGGFGGGYRGGGFGGGYRGGGFGGGFHGGGGGGFGHGGHR